MFSVPQNLLTAKAATGAGLPLACSPELNWQTVGVQVFGTFVGTVVLEGTVSTQAEIAASTAVWQAITGASWTAAALAGITLPYSHIRANVTAYTSGAINVRVV